MMVGTDLALHRSSSVSKGWPRAARHAVRCTDPETGLIYLRARYYDPASAQFVSCDPLVEVAGAGYSYSALS